MTEYVFIPYYYTNSDIVLDWRNLPNGLAEQLPSQYFKDTYDINEKSEISKKTIVSFMMITGEYDPIECGLDKSYKLSDDITIYWYSNPDDNWEENFE